MQVHSVARRNTLKENPHDSTGNRTCGLLACSTVPQPTAPPCGYFSSNCQAKTDLEKNKPSIQLEEFTGERQQEVKQNIITPR